MASSFSGSATWGARKRKQFCSEEKNQKTFILLRYVSIVPVAPANNQKFFGSFFQKRTAFFLMLFFPRGCYHGRRHN